MDKKPAFVLALLITLLISSNYYLIFFLNNDPNSQRQIVTLSRVIDADTAETSSGLTIRFLNINSPEKNTFGYKKSLDYINQFENKTVEIEIVGIDKYQRSLARVYSPEYLNLDLVKKGLATKYLVSESEKRMFAEAESYAISNSLGIWKKSEYFGCFSAEINKYEEVVYLTNHCPNLKMSSWILKDESRKQFVFSDTAISNSFSLFSSKGRDTSKELFWNSGTNIWNDDSDSLYLFDDSGGLVLYESYGY